MKSADFMENKVIKSEAKSMKSVFKIYSQREVDEILSTEKMKENTAVKCEQMIQEAAEKAKKIKRRAYKMALKKFQEEQMALLKENEEKFKTFENSVHAKISTTVEKILEKVKMDVEKHQYFFDMVKKELQLKEYKKLHVSPENYKKMNEVLEENEAWKTLSILLVRKEELNNKECLFEDDQLVYRLDLNHLLEKLEIKMNT